MIQSLLYAIAAMIEMILDPITATAHKKTQAYKALENFASSLNESDNLDNGLTG